MRSAQSIEGDSCLLEGFTISGAFGELSARASEAECDRTFDEQRGSARVWLGLSNRIGSLRLAVNEGGCSQRPGLALAVALL